MRPEAKKRIPTEADSTPLGGLASAFGGLEISVAPEAEKPSVPGPVSKPPPPVGKPGRVVLRRERAHRGGKTVIVIDDFATHLPLTFIEDLARRLRSACGCGGTVRERLIEIQGDQPAKVRAALEAEGFIVAGVK